VLFDFNQILHDGRGGQCDHFTSHKFLDPVNSLAAAGNDARFHIYLNEQIFMFRKTCPSYRVQMAACFIVELR